MSLCGVLMFLGYVPLSLSHVKRERERDRLRDEVSESMPENEREERERLPEDWIGLGALAGGYSLCCHGNSEEEGSVSVS